MESNLFSIDKNMILNYCNNMEDLAQEIVTMFWEEETQSDFDYILENIDDESKYEDLNNRIHKVKTSVAMVGMSKFYNILEKSYRELSDGKNIPENLAIIKETITEYVNQREEIKKQYEALTF